jgi:hypothetical protein
MEKIGIYVVAEFGGNRKRLSSQKVGKEIQFLREHFKNILVHFNSFYVSATLLGVLLKEAEIVAANGGRFAILEPNNIYYRMLEVSGIPQKITVYRKKEDVPLT